jgi:uncharacterized protein (DUF1919 family)
MTMALQIFSLTSEQKHIHSFVPKNYPVDLFGDMKVCIHKVVLETLKIESELRNENISSYCIYFTINLSKEVFGCLINNFDNTKYNFFVKEMYGHAPIPEEYKEIENYIDDFKKFMAYYYTSAP